MKLYYLGPKGTFSFSSSTIQIRTRMTYIPKTNLYEVVNAVSDSNSVAVVPIENSMKVLLI